jgi:hypothetical protein
MARFGDKPAAAALTGTEIMPMTQSGSDVHSNPADVASFANNNSAHTGTPTAPTASPGTNTTQLATTAFVKAAVDLAVQGLTQKPTARAATTGALPANTYANGSSGVGATLTGNSNGALAAQDGVTLGANDILLVLNEAAAAHNGLYTLTQVGDGSHPYILTRHVDMDQSAEFTGAFVPVDNEGTTNKNTIWLNNFTSGLVVGTTAVTFTALTSAGYTAGQGISIAGSVISVSPPNVQAVASASTVTPTFSNDLVEITAQAAALTLANPTGTAADGWGIAIRIKDNGTARGITYGSQYRALGVTLPSTTVISKTLYLGMIFNNTDTKWDVVSVAQEA